MIIIRVESVVNAPPTRRTHTRTIGGTAGSGSNDASSFYPKFGSAQGGGNNITGAKRSDSYEPYHDTYNDIESGVNDIPLKTVSSGETDMHERSLNPHSAQQEGTRNGQVVHLAPGRNRPMGQNETEWSNRATAPGTPASRTR